MLHGKEPNTFAFKHEKFWYLGMCFLFQFILDYTKRLFFVVVLFCFVFIFFETGFLCVALAVLDLAL